MFGKRFSRALAVTTVASLVMATAAFADTVYVTNDVTIDGDSVTGAAGTTGTGYVVLNPTNGTPSGDTNGCNATGEDPLTVELSSSNSKVSLNPTSVELEGCTSASFSYVIASDATGTATISVSSYSGGRTDGTRLYQTADTLVITISGAACTTPAVPTIDASGGTAGSNGWYTAAPTVSSTATGVQWATVANGGTKSVFSTTVPSLGTGTTIVYAKAVSGTCFSAETSRTFQVDPNAPSITDLGATTSPNAAGWYNTNVTNTFRASDGTNESGFPVTFINPFTKTTSGQGIAVKVNSGTVSDVAGNANPGIDSAGFKIDLTDPGVACNTASFILNQPDATVTATVTDGLSGPLSATASSATVNTSSAGTFSASVTGHDIAGNDTTATCSYTVGYNFEGLYAPVDRPNTLNVSKAGQAIPLKWRLTDFYSVGVTNVTSVTVGVGALTCSTTATLDTVEEYAGTSGLQNLGDGYYQFNWKTPTTYANSCKTLGIKMGTSTSDAPAFTNLANFQFKK